jgi:hypothetical protein
MTADIKITVFWYMLCCHVVWQNGDSVSKEPAASTSCPEHGSSRFLWNVGNDLPYYTALHPRRQ